MSLSQQQIDRVVAAGKAALASGPRISASSLAASAGLPLSELSGELADDGRRASLERAVGARCVKVEGAYFLQK